MKVLIVGAGGQGGPCASILARDPQVSEIVLADINLEVAKRVKEKVNSPKIKAIYLDASSVDDLSKAAQGADVVIDLVLPWLATNVMQAAIAAKAHYVNTAFDQPFWDQIVEGKPLSYDKEFKEAGLTALLGCGHAPGLFNVITKYYCDKLDEVENVKILLGKKDLEKNYGVKAYNPGWAPKQALIDTATEPCIFKNGKYERVPIFSGIEEYTFPDPVGEIAIKLHSHEEAYSIPIGIGKNIKNCEFKYILDLQAATFIKTGFTPDNEVEMNGIKVKPIDVLDKLIKNPGNAFLDEEQYVKSKKAFIVIIEIEGIKNGVHESYKVCCPPMASDGKQAYELFGTSNINVALPAVTGAKMCLEGAKKGIIFAECLDAERFLELIRDTGLEYDWKDL